MEVKGKKGSSETKRSIRVRDEDELYWWEIFMSADKVCVWEAICSYSDFEINCSLVEQQIKNLIFHKSFASPLFSYL